MKGVAGTWKDLTDSRELDGRQPDGAGAQHRRRDDGRRATAICRRRSRSTSQGEILELKNTINTMVDQLNSFASEVTRVAREVGTEGKLGGQAEVPGVAGTWKDLTDSVNSMAGNLTAQVRNIAEVTTAVAQRRSVAEDHRRRPRRDPRAEEHHQHDGRSAQRRSPSEVTRVAREVGTEGKLGGQADVRGVAGTWKDLTDSVNSMAGNLTAQVRNIADVTTAVANGDLSQEDHGRRAAARFCELKNTINTMVDQLSVVRVGSHARGARGRHGREARRPGRGAGRRRHVEGPDRHRQLDGVEPDGAGAQHRRGDDGGRERRPLARRSRSTCEGEILELKNTINTMVDQLRSFAAEVTRVAREVGTEGKLGGQARRAGRRRHVEGSHRLRQLHGRQPHRPGAQHRRGDDRGRERRSVEEDHGRRARARSSS